MADIYGQLVKAQAENVTSDPGTLPAGLLWCRTDTNSLKFYDGAATRTIVTLDSTQTLTNKTLSGNIAVTLVSGAATLTLPTTTGTLATLANAENFTNKTLNATNTLTGCLVSNYLDLSEQGSSPGVPSSGYVRFYAKNDHNLYFQTSSGIESQVGSGSGEKNYVQTGSNTAASWTASGAGITVATDTTAADLPRPNTTKTGILLTGVSGSTAYAYYRFILDDADANKKLKLQFDMKPGTAVASDFKVDVYSNTANDYSTGNTRLVLSTDSSAVSALPALTGTFRTTFDAPSVSAKYIEVRIGMNATQTHTLTISDVIVGPGVVTQSAAVTQRISFTPTVTNLTLNATGKSDPAGFYWRVGDQMGVQISWRNGSGGAATGSTLTLNLPTGFTVNSSALAVASDSNIGTASIYNVVDASHFDRAYSVTYDGSGIKIMKPGVASYVSGTDLGASAEVSVVFMVPVNEWAGAGTVNVVQNDVEYTASTNGTWDAAATTANTVYGPAGAPVTGSLTASRIKTALFLTPAQAGDEIKLEYKCGGGDWTEQADSVYPNAQTASFNFGAYIDWNNTTSTQVAVIFGQYAQAGSTFNSATGASNWSASVVTAWRVKKIKGGQAVGFGQVTQTSAGLVKSAGQLLGTNTNDTANAGNVGEVIRSSVALSSAAPITSPNTVNITSIVLTAGDWDVRGGVQYDCSNAVPTIVQSGISTTSATLPANSRIMNPTSGEFMSYTRFASAITINEWGHPIPAYQVTVASGSTQTLYLVAGATFSSGTMAGLGYIEARRVR